MHVYVTGAKYRESVIGSPAKTRAEILEYLKDLVSFFCVHIKKNFTQILKLLIYIRPPQHQNGDL